MRHILCLLFFLSTATLAVKHQDFKTCEQASFCKRNRNFADRVLEHSVQSAYVLVAPSIQLVKPGFIQGDILRGTVAFSFALTLFENGLARFQIDEKNETKGVPELKRYDEAGNHVLMKDTMPKPIKSGAKLSTTLKDTTIQFINTKIILNHNPFAVDIYSTQNGQEILVLKLNERGFMNIEEQRRKESFKVQDGSNNDEANPSENLDQEEGLWEESFNGKSDSKPKGPESLALDITFPGFEHVYGIPEHATRLSLKETRGKSIYGEDASLFYTDPYRLYNLDVFEYEVDSPMALYGAIPFLMAHRQGATTGFFWLNGAETWIDITKRREGESITAESHWISESGIMDFFVFPGPNIHTIFKQFGELTGFNAMPHLSGIAYHQSRWNYVSQDDVSEVDKNFDLYDIPYDILYLDIEHTDGKKYFTWDKAKFPEPGKMIEDLGKKGRKLVTIVDPHVKRENGYWLYDEAKNLDILVKDNNKNEFDGWCWPGSSAWVDFFNPAAQKWNLENYKFTKYDGSARNHFIWNDMNEPSVFSGPEITMPKDNIHYGGWEHRDLHNIYGLMYHNVTTAGLIAREEIPRRPFVLSRAFFAGSQKSTAVWTGDNLGTWEHLAISTPMILSNSIGGMAFSGADIGGFFGNPDSEMLVRWYQTGAFQPFMRAHAHIDTKRREPYLLNDPERSMIRDAVRIRYSLLPIWYTAFETASRTNLPIIRPHFIEYPNDSDGFTIDDQFFVGDSGIIVKPITNTGLESTELYLTNDGEIYYNYFQPHNMIFTKNEYGKTGSWHAVAAPLHRIPVYIRGGSIITRRDRIRRSSESMKNDPFTLVVALSQEKTADGTLYLDDGETYDYRNGEFIRRKFTFSKGILKSEDIKEVKSESLITKTMSQLRVEKLIVYGLDKEPKSVFAGKKSLEFTFYPESNNMASILIVKDPAVKIVQDWEILIE